MTPRPLYKWKSFWLGILVLVFLGWAWARSMNFNDRLDWGTGSRSYILEGRPGHMVFFWWPSSKKEFSRSSVEIEGSLSFPAWLKIWAGRDGVPGFTVAHWFVILAFLIPWSAFLAWRWKRQRKLSAFS